LRCAQSDLATVSKEVSHWDSQKPRVPSARHGGKRRDEPVEPSPDIARLTIRRCVRIASVPPDPPALRCAERQNPAICGVLFCGGLLGEFVANADHVRGAWRPAFTARYARGLQKSSQQPIDADLLPSYCWNHSNMEFGMPTSDPNPGLRTTSDDRRDFLARCGRFAVVTPPAVAFLLSTSLKSDAIAQSGGNGNNGFGNGGGDGSPNGKQDTTR
jgi:hypothetical protein